MGMTARREARKQLPKYRKYLWRVIHASAREGLYSRNIWLPSNPMVGKELVKLLQKVLEGTVFTLEQVGPYRAIARWE